MAGGYSLNLPSRLGFVLILVGKLVKGTSPQSCDRGATQTMFMLSSTDYRG